MKLTNPLSRYGAIAILLHWLMAIIIIFLLALGWYMTALPISLQKLRLFGWHKEYGLLILGLAVIRLFWRSINTTPYLSLPRWEKLAAHSVHWLLYVFMLAQPLIGWLITSAAGLSISFFGLFTIPTLITPNEEIRLLVTTIHHWLGYAFSATIALHILAALKHHFINKNNILRRILW